MSSTSPSPSASSSAAAGEIKLPSSLKIVGIILAVASGVLIGCSFVFKKKGLLRSQAGQTAGEGVAYLKSVLWWTGMIMMIAGELCNFAAYAFVEALVVTPLGALSVVISAILSSLFLNEKLTFFGWLGCGLSIIGSTIIALNSPPEPTVGQIREFQKLFLSVGFLVYAGVLIAIALSIIFYFGPKYGSKNMIWYILVCSVIGGISVSVTTGLGSAIVTTAMGDNQFKYWFIYFLLAFVAVTLITEVFYLNKALAMFNTAMVTPTYYVIFTFCSMVTTVVLFQGLKASAQQIITIVMGFLTICVGITILQMSKVDPTEFKSLDRRSTILLQAARKQTEAVEEKNATGIEDPGIDTLRGSFGTFGSIIRARSARRLSQSSRGSSRFAGAAGRYSDLERMPGTPESRKSALGANDPLAGMKRHQLWDAPMPPYGDSDSERISMQSRPSTARKQTIKFDVEDVVHQYPRTGAAGDASATHEHRLALHSPGVTPPVEALDSVQELVSPPGLEGEDAVRSAPPRIGTHGIDEHRATDPFDGSPSTTTLASFPSTSVTSLYEDAQSQPRQHRRYQRSSSSSRDYPKGDKRDDAEESMRLWNRSSEEDERDDGEGGSSPPIGGIRLVTSSSKPTPF
ncbi:DUF803-domain-containing protein [Dentipellis sp. KUC8613]|nr:DUF803-domain-containing protein [Dentipellis sp. KUC8613]